MTPEAAVDDFKRRVELINSTYARIVDGQLRWIRLIDSGRQAAGRAVPGLSRGQVVSNRIEGFLPGRILNYLMCLHTSPRSIFLSRHGQSEYNELGKIGGDSGLTAAGAAYASALAEWSDKHIQHNEKGEAVPARLWTSSMRRTIETAAQIPHRELEGGWIQMRARQWRALDELYAGGCDGMTYAEIKAAMPEEFAARSGDKLQYRYPRGESYLDVIQRLDPIIHEMERCTEPLLVVGHQGILRIIAAFFTGLSREEAVSSSMPLHTVVKLTPHAYGCEVERIQLIDVADSPSC